MGGRRSRNTGWLDTLEKRAQQDRELRERLSSDLFPERGSAGRFSMRQMLLALPGIATAVAAVSFVAFLALVTGDRTTTTNVETLPSLESATPLPTDAAQPKSVPATTVQQAVRTSPTPSAAPPPTDPATDDPPAPSPSAPDPEMTKQAPPPTSDPSPTRSVPTQNPPTSPTPTVSESGSGGPPPTRLGPPTVELRAIGPRLPSVRVEAMPAGKSPELRYAGRLKLNESFSFYDSVIRVQLISSAGLEIKVNGTVRPLDSIAPRTWFIARYDGVAVVPPRGRGVIVPATFAPEPDGREAGRRQP